MAETEQHFPPGPQIMDGPPEDDRDWRIADRLIILMSLTIVERILRRRKTTMLGDVKSRVLDRMVELIAEYKHPRARRAKR